jgi:hypothetical protein
MGIGFNTPTLQPASPVPRTIPETGIPMGQMELAIPLGGNEASQKLEVIHPPQNANAPTKIKGTDTLNTPSKPVQTVGAMYLR